MAQLTDQEIQNLINNDEIIGATEDGVSKIVLQPNGHRSISEVSVNIPLSDGQIIPQSRIADPNDETSPLSKLIVAVQEQGASPVDPESMVPIGFFIVNEYKADFDLEITNEDVTRPRFIIAIDRLFDVQTVTCLHAPPNQFVNNLNTDEFVLGSPVTENLGWIVLTRPTAEALFNGILAGESYTLNTFLSETGVGTYLETLLTTPFNLDVEGIDSSLDTLPNYLRQVGYLDAFNLVALTGSDAPSSFSLLDGEGGPGGGRARGVVQHTNEEGELVDVGQVDFDDALMFNQGSVTVNPDPDYTGNEANNRYESLFFYTGTKSVLFKKDLSDGVSFRYQSSLPQINRRNVEVGSGDTVSLFPLNGTEGELPEFPPGQIAVGIVDFKRLHSFAEISTLLFFINNRNIEDRSFKTNANHDFGIIYYDQRGRHGFVNPLVTTYVPGYSNDERQGPPGSVSVELQLNHTPPDWAHNYKIAYSRNTSVGNFVQYSSGGAFIQEIQDQEISESNQNIYVSLNYLQQHPISYSTAYGARGIDGGLNIYKYQEGDRLRVISFDNGGNENREYVPSSFEFEVVDYRILEDNVDNPLANVPVPTNQLGAFVVLKNNPSAYGFNYSAVSALSDNWGKNCIFELYSPLKSAEEEDRIYYEIGSTGAVQYNADATALVHEPQTITLTKGDVWFRKVPVNVREFSSGQFNDLIFDQDGEIGNPTPNFKSVYLETMSVSDLFRSNSHSIGRPNVVSESAGQVIRESSITYSDPTDPSSKKPKFSSFNLFNINFKDLPEVYGNLTYLANFGEFLVALQKDKVSLVPLNRNVLSDASGGQNIIASKEILGSAIFVDEEKGSDSPSSVIEIDSKIYFGSTGSFSICKMEKSKRGLLTISDKNVTALIRDEIIAKQGGAGVVRLVGGYDPLKEEYLITILSVEEISFDDGTNPQLVEQPGGPVQDPGPQIADSLIVPDSNLDGVITIEDLLALELYPPLITIDALEENGFTVLVEGQVAVDPDATVEDLIEAGLLTVADILNSGVIDVEDLLVEGQVVVDDPTLVANPGDFIVPDLNEDGELTINEIPGINAENFVTQAASYLNNQVGTFEVFMQLFDALGIDINDVAEELGVEVGGGLTSSITDLNQDSVISVNEALDFASDKKVISALIQKLSSPSQSVSGDNLDGELVDLGDIRSLLLKLKAIDLNTLKKLLSDSNVDSLTGTDDLLTILANYGQYTTDLDLGVTFDPDE